MENHNIQTKNIKTCLKRIRDCDERIEEAIRAKKQKKEAEKELKKLKINLIKDKKIERINMTFEQWLENTTYQYFYVYRCEGEYEYIVWKGEDTLTDEETKHFNNFITDYLFYNYPDYDIHDEMTLSQHGFEDGDLSYHVFDRNNI